jgi:hypothetical protein
MAATTRGVSTARKATESMRNGEENKRQASMG